MTPLVPPPRLPLNRRSHAPLWRSLSRAVLGSSLTFSALAGCSDAYRESGPVDALRSGTLCLPSQPSCLDSTLLDRDDAIGASRLDYRLTNLDTEKADVTLSVTTLPTESNPVDAGPDSGTPEDSTSLLEFTERLSGSERRDGRLTREQLTTRDFLSFQIACQDCRVQMDYTLVNAPLECRSDEDCTGSWRCLETTAQCVECASSADCADRQTCSLLSNRCLPPESGGCKSASSHEAAPPPLLGLCFALFLLFLLKRRRPRLLALACCVLVLTSTSSAFTAEPPRTSLGVTVGPRWIAGTLAGVTRRGVGLRVSQELRWRHLGAAVSLGTRYHLTTQQAPPLSRELQLYTVAAGPRVFYRVADLNLAAGADLQHVGLVSNSISRLTGPRLNYLSAGGWVGARYDLDLFQLGAQLSLHPVFGLKSTLVSADLSLRLAFN